MVRVAAPDPVLDPLLVDERHHHLVAVARRAADGGVRERVVRQRHAVPHHAQLHGGRADLLVHLPHPPLDGDTGAGPDLHVAVPGEADCGAAGGGAALQVAVVLAAGLVVLVLHLQGQGSVHRRLCSTLQHREHGVGGVDGQGEGEEDGEVALVVVDGGGGGVLPGHRPVQHEAGALAAPRRLLSLWGG